jgi:opacity protein-like surface antigen
MRTRIVALAFVASLFAAPSFAADVVRPLRVVAPVNPFLGPYVGLHGGWGWSNASSSYNNNYFNPPHCGNSYFWGCPVDVDPQGAFVGGQIGVNFAHPSGLVWGLQADYSFASLHDSGVGPFYYNKYSTEVQLNVKRLATIEARLGMVNGPWMHFVTLGWGWAQAERSAFNPVFIGPTPNVDTRWHTGWTAGFGTEYALNSKWTFLLEYRFFNGNTQNYSLAFAGGTRVDLNINTVRFGVNMHF